MQTITDETRSLLQAPNLETSAGIELLDENDQILEDITSDLIVDGSKVDRSNYADIHGTCTVKLLRELDWTRARVRLYQTPTVGPHIVQVEVEDRPAVTISQAENSTETWDTGTFTDTIVVAGALCLNHA